MSKLFILGNGFDLEHNLKTKYLDFRKYMKQKNPKLYENFYEFYRNTHEVKIHPITHEVLVDNLPFGEEPETYLLWKDLENNMEKVNEDFFQIFDVNELGLEYSYPGDVAAEDTVYYSFLDTYQSYNTLGSDFKNELKNWINSISYTSAKKIKEPVSNADLFLSFNYTSTLEEIYNIKYEKICYIHGCNKYNDDLIIGHNNQDNLTFYSNRANYFDSNVENKKYEILYEYYDSIYKNVYKNLYKIDSLFDDLEDIDDIKEIIIIGHSLANVDLEYFKYIQSRVNSNVNWRVYFFDENDKIKFENILIQEIKVDRNKISILPSSKFYK